MATSRLPVSCFPGTALAILVASAGLLVSTSTLASDAETCITIRRGELGNVVDTFLSGDAPSYVAGADQNIFIGLSSAGNQNVALYNFDLSPIPAGASVTSAHFTLYASYNESPNSVTVHRVLQPWAELTATASNFDAAGGFDATVLAGFSGWGYKTMDITPVVAAWVSGQAPAYGLLLQEPLATHHTLSSETGASYRPYLEVCYAESTDQDGDGVDDGDDNCPEDANADQLNTDGDAEGDACDADDDGDGVEDGDDNCPLLANADQLNTELDAEGDACDADDDNDGIADADDLCPLDADPDQADLDGDGIGDACDTDNDNDGVSDAADICPGTAAGEPANPQNGCSIDQLCPCAGPKGQNMEWSSKSQYVACVSSTSAAFAQAGVITSAQANAYVSAANASQCGGNPCDNQPLLDDPDSPFSPALEIKVLSFARSGLFAPNTARVFAGSTEVFANASGKYIVPLRDGAGKVIKDWATPALLSLGGIPAGVYVVLRNGDGEVTQGLSGYLLLSSVAMEVTSSWGGAAHGGVQNLSFENQGDGNATLGNDHQDEFWKELGQLRVKATVTAADDLVKGRVCD